MGRMGRTGNGEDRDRFLFSTSGRGLRFAGRAGMTFERIDFGKRGEDLACVTLEERGYEIVARRYRLPGGEIDIVARDGETLVFVEVKARASHEFGSAAEAVTPSKQLRLTRLATEYLMRHHLHDRPCRFDVVAIHFDTGTPEIEVFQNAFDA